MKKIMLAATAVFLAFAVNAQEIPERKKDGFKPKDGHGRMHHRRPGGQGGMEFQKLNLTETQKEQFKSQREGFRKQMEELKKNENITIKEQRSRMENLRKEQHSKMQSLLTADQKAQLEKMKTDRKALQEVDAKARAEKMKIRLGLSDEQSAKMEKNRKEMSEKMKALRENKSISEEKKREDMKELMKNQRESMKSILTAEQQKKLQEGMHRGSQKGGQRHDGKKHEMNKKVI